MSARLHMLNKAPDHPRYRQCLAALEAGDVLVLMESGVLALTDGAPFASAPDDVQVYAIAGDLAVYSRMRVLKTGVGTIDYQGFTELVCRIGSPLSW